MNSYDTKDIAHMIQMLDHLLKHWPDSHQPILAHMFNEIERTREQWADILRFDRKSIQHGECEKTDHHMEYDVFLPLYCQHGRDLVQWSCVIKGYRSILSARPCYLNESDAQDFCIHHSQRVCSGYLNLKINRHDFSDLNTQQKSIHLPKKSIENSRIHRFFHPILGHFSFCPSTHRLIKFDRNT